MYNMYMYYTLNALVVVDIFKKQVKILQCTILIHNADG